MELEVLWEDPDVVVVVVALVEQTEGLAVEFAVAVVAVVDEACTFAAAAASAFEAVVVAVGIEDGWVGAFVVVVVVEVANETVGERLDSD